MRRWFGEFGKYASVVAVAVVLVMGCADTGLAATTDDSVATQANVRLFGAKGDAVSDDTAAVQAAVNSVVAGGGVVVFPAGTYMVTSVNMSPGTELRGEPGAIIKRPKNQPNHTMTFQTAKKRWNSASDSPPLVLRSLVIDGNRDNQGAYNRYELEQAALVYLDANPAGAGRLRVIVDGCTFKDCVGDALEIVRNVDLSVSNCSFSNCFRGAFVFVGGNTKGRITNCVVKGTKDARGIDVEIAAAGHPSVSTTLDGPVPASATRIRCVNLTGWPTGGYAFVGANRIAYTGITGNTLTGCSGALAHDSGAVITGDTQSVDLQMSNVELNGCFDIAARERSKMTFSKITWGDMSNLAVFNVDAADSSSVQVDSSKFLIPGWSTTRRIYRANDVRISNTEFTLSSRRGTAGSTVSIAVGAPYPPGAKHVEMNNCVFGVSPDSPMTDKFHGLDIAPGTAELHKLVLNNCRFGANLDRGISVLNGGFVQADGCYFDSTIGIWFSGSPSHVADIHLNRCSYGPSNKTNYHAGAKNGNVLLQVAP